MTALESGTRSAVSVLAFEEANLLHARRLSRRYQWWQAGINCMQGLTGLYRYQARRAEWARLVEEIRPDYCTDDDQPIPGREDNYSAIMQYCVEIAEDERDVAGATTILQKLVAFARQQAASVLDLPVDASLSDIQRNRLRTLSVAVFDTGRLLDRQLDEACLEHYQEALKLYGRIGDTVAQAATEFNIGNAYLTVPAIRDLDAAEAGYERSLRLLRLDDALGRSRCLAQLGTVHRERLKAAIERRDEADVLEGHLSVALERYLEALRLCPKDALDDIRSIHTQLGNLFRRIGRRDLAREQYEEAAHIAERTGNRFDAGSVRLNMAIMFMPPGGSTPERAGLLRARAYAEAAVRDFKSYDGRAASFEANAGRLLDIISGLLAALPQ